MNEYTEREEQLLLNGLYAYTDGIDEIWNMSTFVTLVGHDRIKSSIRDLQMEISALIKKMEKKQIEMRTMRV